ncbi:helix-turn-helix domain-containing protein [Actinacidiphila glaucinigra]|uniref:helix-turn-helix domain-containing protein n=1 Tax=Actinacidiphila glaucinigra TaxID=235986 RepID=UPI0035D8BB40
MPAHTPPRRRRPDTNRDQLTQDLKTQYEQGKSIRVLAKEAGRSYGSVHRLLHNANTTFRPRGGMPHRTKT